MLKTLSILGYLGMIGGLFGLVALRAVLAPTPGVILVQVAAFGLFLWARVTFGRRSFHAAANPTEGGLVTGGPYRFIRHPIYTAFCVFIGAGIAAHWSWAAAGCGVVIFVSAGVRIFCEETLVTARYPEYRAYAARTWRMIPFIF